MDEILVKEPARRGRWIAGVGLIAAGVVALGLWGMRSPGAVSYYVTPTEVVTNAPAARSPNLRLGGRVAVGTLQRSGSSVAFSVTDGHNVVPVRYRGEIPDTLKESTDVVAEGKLTGDGTLVATRVLAKCSSRFVSKPERRGAPGGVSERSERQPPGVDSRASRT